MAGPASHSGQQKRSGKPLTGRTILIWLGAFFGVMLIANAFFVYFALSSFPGVEVESAYQRGQNYAAEIAAADAQNARGWQVEVALSEDAGSALILTAEARDQDQGVISGLTMSAELRHLRGAEFDTVLRFTEVESGRYEARIGVIPRGSWTMTLEAEQAGERVYRSKSKIFIQ